MKNRPRRRKGLNLTSVRLIERIAARSPHQLRRQLNVSERHRLDERCGYARP
jgi:hypothetical protein